MLATGLMTGYGYLAEVFTALYSGDRQELATLHDRLTGIYAFSFWGAVVLNFLPLQLMWFRGLRRNPWTLGLVGLSVAVGMWFERYMLLVTSLYHDWLVSSFGEYHASFWEWTLFAGMFGVFLAPFLLFVRFLPVISAFEIRETRFEEQQDA
jgi:molybdopterin-containing oxidoreductase family membrane subunit